MNIECGWCRDGEQLIEGCIEGDGYYAGCPEWYHKKGENKQCASESDAKELKSVNDYKNYYYYYLFFKKMRINLIITLILN